MIKSILVCTDGSPHGESATRYGIYFSRRLKASLSALHVLDSRMLEGPMIANVSGWIGAEAFSDPLTQFRAIMQEKGDAIATAFKATCEKEGLSGVTAKVVWGHPAKIILQEEVQAEMTILGQDGEHDEITGEWTGSTVDRVVRHSIKPCLVVPEAFTTVNKIMIAYDGSPHASRALHEAIELALELSIPLVICTVVEGGDHNRAISQADTAMRLARAHECAAAHLIVEGKASELILQKAMELKCNLLVAGAHGHTRIRDMIIGSTATHLLNHSNLPLLLVR